MLKSIKFDFAMFFPLHLSGTMENRTEVIKEYFELRLLLNRANQKSNQKTELDFEIRKLSNLEFHFIAFAKGHLPKAFLSICHTNDYIKWLTPDQSRFHYLGKYCADELNKKQSQLNNINLEQSKKFLVDHVRIRLRSLGFG